MPLRDCLLQISQRFRIFGSPLFFSLQLVMPLRDCLFSRLLHCTFSHFFHQMLHPVMPLRDLKLNIFSTPELLRLVSFDLFYETIYSYVFFYSSP